MRTNLCKIMILAIIPLFLFCTSANTQTKSEKIQNILALGDSYTIGESVAEGKRWPEQLKSALENKFKDSIRLKIIAKTGWRTDDLRSTVNQMQIDEKYDLVTLLIGVNNQYQGKSIDEYPKEFRLCLKQAIDLANSIDNVIVVSIPDYAFTPFGQTKNPLKISEEIDKYNDINRSISKEFGVKYVNITDLTRNGLKDPKLVAEDGLHPSGHCYTMFVPRILEAMKMN